MIPILVYSQIESLEKLTVTIVKVPNAVPPTIKTNLLYAYGGHLYWSGARIDSVSSGVAPTNFWTEQAGATNNAYYNRSGNVGIGKTNPTALLDVNGDALINGLVAGTGGGFLSLRNTVFGNTSPPFSGAGDQVLIGYNAGKSIVGAQSNVIIGSFAGDKITTASQNTIIGYAAGTENVSGGQNTIMGKDAGFWVTADNNSFFGMRAGMNTTTGYCNTAVGSVAMNNNGSGHSNVAIGASSLFSNTTASNLVSIGDSSLFHSTGGGNTAVGSKSAWGNTTGCYNTAIGHQAMYNVTTGYQNTALGEIALYYLTSGKNNVAVGMASGGGGIGDANTSVGASSLSSVTTGMSNVAIGACSLKSNLSTCNLVAVGDSSLRSNTSGYYNTAIGSKSLEYNTSGIYNTAVGQKSLYANSIGSYNTAVGVQALDVNSVGNFNTAMGMYSLTANIRGSGNTAYGFHSSYANETGYSNTAVGSAALHNNTAGHSIVAIGDSALFYNYASNNVAVGYKSVYTNTFASGITAVGYSAGYSATGQYNTFIGGYSGVNAGSGENNTCVGYSSAGSSSLGASNTFIGAFSGQLAGGANMNTAVGYYGQSSNTTGAYNVSLGAGCFNPISIGAGNYTGDGGVAVGTNALSCKLDGGQDIAIGYGAGSIYTGSASRQHGSQSIFIGYLTGSYAANCTNETVIGNILYGHGSNTVTIGNSSITDTYLSGKVRTGSLMVGPYNVSVTADCSIPPASSMVYPGVGIPVSTGSAWASSITDNSANWNTSFGWGDHSTFGYLVDPMTATGDIIFRSNSGVDVALPHGNDNNILVTKKHTATLPEVDYYVPSWVSPPWLSMGYLTTESDPSVYAWAKAATKPAYTYTEVGAAPSSHVSNTSNPHSVTKAQVGLGSVENTALSTWAGTSSVTTLGAIVSCTSFATSGSVGIGTTSPTGLINGVSSSANAINFDMYSSTATVKSNVVMRKARGTPASPSRVSSGDQLGAFTFIGGYDASGTFTWPSGAQAGLFAKAEEDYVGSTNLGAYFTIETTGAGSGSRTEKMRVTGGGTVAIGTTAPSTTEILDVNGNQRISGYQKIIKVAAHPTIASGETAVYTKGNYYVVAYNDGGTMKYRYMDLTSTNATWTYNTVAP